VRRIVSTLSGRTSRHYSQTVNYLYDGSGTRMATQSTANGTTTLTSYIGSIEEVQTTGSSTQTTTYYAVGGERVAADVNGTFYYFGYDALGSQVAVLDASGNLVGAQLYGPYGASRYNTGTLPTSIGFTGQRADTITGLDYYNARYYDPGVGQFLSVDSVQGNAVGMYGVPGDRTTVIYELSSASHVVTWRWIHNPRSPLTFWRPFLPPDEYHQQIQALCDLVIEKTGLQVYTIDHLIEEEATTSR
jgi:RHS repeat-associated protein